MNIVDLKGYLGKNTVVIPTCVYATPLHIVLVTGIKPILVVVDPSTGNISGYTLSNSPK
jgi:dTDP-4-amino-4,6-dideoxygalactose transaminase